MNSKINSTVFSSSMLFSGLVALSFLFSIQASASFFNPYVIYGDDNRRDYYEAKSSQDLDLVDSTVALFSNSDIRIDASSAIAKLTEKSYKQRYGLCESEPFVNQNSGAFCSGFLVGPDLIATAGHCISSSECSDVSFVFGYRMTSSTSDTSQVPANNVYRCKEVLSREETRRQDYALVRIDRVVQGAKVLSLAKTSVQVGDDLTLIGHPSGLPVKIADGAKVRKNEEGFFVATTDSYGGNSGSAVFNKAGEVVGILVRGESDFVYDSAQQCTTSRKCTEIGCRGEDVTFISYVASALEKIKN